MCFSAVFKESLIKFCSKIYMNVVSTSQHICLSVSYARFILSSAWLFFLLTYLLTSLLINVIVFVLYVNLQLVKKKQHPLSGSYSNVAEKILLAYFFRIKITEKHSVHPYFKKNYVNVLYF